MNCCQECFEDNELKSIIASISTNAGRCSFCDEEREIIIDVEELQDFFLPILELFKPDVNGKYIKYFFKNYWNVFHSNNSTSINIFFKNLFPDNRFSHLLNTKISFDVNFEDYKIYWDEFVNEIKHINRFFIDRKFFDKESLKTLFQYHIKVIPKGTSFFRGRISKDKITLTHDEMKSPPKEFANPGRANPKGIPYLYLANNIDTTIYEVRASYLDYVCIAEFISTIDLKIVKLGKIENVSPFIDSINIKEYVTDRHLLDIFGAALSKPLRRYDSDNEYFPTQFLCEYIKSLGIDGVEYKSAMFKGGFNYAFFKEDNFDIKDIMTKEVTDITMKIN